jgi:hypothetical protein
MRGMDRAARDCGADFIAPPQKGDNSTCVKFM